MRAWGQEQTYFCGLHKGRHSLSDSMRRLLHVSHAAVDQDDGMEYKRRNLPSSGINAAVKSFFVTLISVLVIVKR